MAGNNSIQFLRGTRNQIAQNTQQLQDGQPLYNTTDNYLSIGGGGSNDLNKLPIACRELKGYVTDLSDQINSVTNTTEQWSISYESGKGIKLNNQVKVTENIQIQHNTTGNTTSIQNVIIPSAVATGVQAVAFGGKSYRKCFPDVVTALLNGGDGGRTPTSAEGNQSLAFGGSCHAYGGFSFAGGKDCIAYQGGSYAIGGTNTAGMTEAEFNEFWWDADKETAKNGGLGKKDGKITDREGYNYENSYSFAVAMGSQSVAKGWGAYAFGEAVQALGRNSCATGLETKAKLPRSFAMGYRTNAEGTDSATFGYNTKTTNLQAFACGSSTISTGEQSFSAGQLSEANGNRSFATGYNTYADGHNSFTSGEQSRAKGMNAAAFGYGGRSHGYASVTIGQNCVAGIKDTTAATAGGQFAGGFAAEATGPFSFAFGGVTDSFKNPTKATKACAIALGCGAVASGDYQSTAIGLNVTASGNASLAMGWNSTATQLASVAIGESCESKAEKCTTVGWGNVNNVKSALVCGRFGKAESDTDHLFVVGGGSSKDKPANLFSVGTNITDISSNYLNVNCKGINFNCNPRVQSNGSWHNVLLEDIPKQSGSYVITSPDYMDLNCMPFNGDGNLGLFFLNQVDDSHTGQSTIKYYRNDSMLQKGAIYYVRDAGDLGSGILIKFGQSTQQNVFALFKNSDGGIFPGLIHGKTFTRFHAAGGNTSQITMQLSLKTKFNLPPYIC